MRATRRSLLGLAAAAPIAMLAATASRGQTAPACYDSASLPLSQRNRRRSLGYVDASTAPGKSCGKCAFFTLTAPSPCGTCQLLGGGPVQAGAVCNSFAAKAR